MHTELLAVICILPDQKIRDAINAIDSSGGQIALVVDTDRKLLGSITDGDIRRGLLKGMTIDHEARQIMNSKPRSLPFRTSQQAATLLMREADIGQIPIIDDEGRVVDIVFESDFERPQAADHQVVIMAGGMGERLRPITERIPKPMIEVGGRPVLETIIQRFQASGFVRIALCVNYRAEMIVEHFGDGSAFGVEITYVHEEKRMGTAGALSLLPARPAKPLIVTNGDVLTNMDYGKLLEFHYLQGAAATMALNIFKYQLPYGAIELAGHRIRKITEKPIQQFFVNAGIYVISPEALDRIPAGMFYDMTTFFESLPEADRAAFPLHEYWLDIGQKPDLDKATAEFAAVFGESQEES